MIKLRYAPSPTWNLHIWTLRIFLYNYLFAKANSAEIIFRIEDTDQERSKKEFEDNIIKWLKIFWIMNDEMPIFRQSERTEIYCKYLQRLIDEDKAYYCFMSKEELDCEREEQMKLGMPSRCSGKFRDYPKEKALERIKAWESAVIRLKVPCNETIIYDDLIKWRNTTNTKELWDFVIARSLNSPLYHITVVVDDHLMDITHVIRWEDHISNTPKQILLYRALGWSPPLFWHIPLILNPDWTKMSKRYSNTDVYYYLNKWYLIEAIINFIALLWWNTPWEKEFYSLEELIKAFSLDWVNKSWARFDEKKLNWINSSYIKKMPFEKFKEAIKPFLSEEFKNINDQKAYDSLLMIAKDRIDALSEVNNDIWWYCNPKRPLSELFPNDKMKVTAESALVALKEIISFLDELDNWDNIEIIKDKISLWIQAKWQKNGYYLWPLRIALSREIFSPNTLEIMTILWKQETLKRVDETIVALS